jgi:hypothetical protein
MYPGYNFIRPPFPQQGQMQPLGQMPQMPNPQMPTGQFPLNSGARWASSLRCSART